MRVYDRRVKGVIVLVLAGMLTLPATAAAAGKVCPNRAKAKRAFNAGHLAYHRGEYEEAVLKFEVSFKACEEPLTMLAIGNAYERLGEHDAALEYLVKYREHAPKRERADLDTRIEALEERIADREADKKRKDDERKRKQEAARKAKEEREREQQQQQQQEASEPLLLSGWIGGGVGLAALAVSSMTGVAALSLDGELSDGCVEGNCPADRGDDIDRLEALSAATDALLVIGAALAAGGVVVVVLGQPGDGAADVGFSLAPGGAALKGSF